MAVKYIDTDEVNTVITDLNSYTKKLEEEIDNLFKRFERVNTDTYEWVGQSSKKYFNLVANDKKLYVAYINKLKELNSELNSHVLYLTETIKKNINTEKNNRG